jgi:Cu-Zn family superoxide dismutase
MNAIAVFNPVVCSGIEGSVIFRQKEGYSIVEFNLKGFKPFQEHAIHIHKFGISSIENACQSTCDHYNPENKLHGNIFIHGNDRHAGDLINNLKADSQGKFNFVYQDPLIKVEDIYGRSIVIHSGIDDLGIYRDDFLNKERQRGSATTGNAGGRIACSVIGRCK